MGKYKLTWKDLTLRDFRIYLFALFKAFIPKKKIKSLDELEDFIQTKSAWVSQVTLYGYLKTRMGTRYVLHFENDVFMKSVNLAKWNIYAVALQDLTFFTFSYLKATTNYEDTNKDNPIYNEAPIDEFDNDVSMFTDARRYVHPTSTTENNIDAQHYERFGASQRNTFTANNIPNTCLLYTSPSPRDS